MKLETLNSLWHLADILREMLESCGDNVSRRNICSQLDKINRTTGF